MSKGRTAIYLFRNDLRLHDNECLKWAFEANVDFVVPLFCFDPDHYAGTYHNQFPKTGYPRANFIRESVEDLRKSFVKRGTNLIVRHARPSEAVGSLVKACQEAQVPVTSLVLHKEVASEEVKVEKSLKDICHEHKIQFKTIWGASLIHRDDLPFASKQDVPDTYTGFRKSVEGNLNRKPIRALIPEPAKYKPLPPVKDGKLGDIPSLSDLGVKKAASAESYPDKRTAFPFKGGETAALERVRDYYWNTDNVAKYKETRNGLLGADYSTKFSPWLANGTLSPRYIYHELKKYEAERYDNQSTYWVIFELLWRDYFRFVVWKYGDTVFYPGGIRGQRYDWKTDPALFKKWAEGRTGVPFVDANMRELLHTGWMSNRGRQNVASFLVKDLNLDWRLGAEWFESMLLDHDVHSNYGNWNYSAGIGNDPRENRKFNMIKQATDYDGQGDFVRTWVPELKSINGGSVHMPWTLSEKEVKGVELGVDYPAPVVKAPEWNRHTHKKSGGGGGPRGGGGLGGGGRGFSKPKSGQQRGIDFYFKSQNAK